MPLFRRKKQNNMGLMALAGETAKMAKNMMVLDKTEAALEREMEKQEKRTPPSTKIGKIRRKGEHLIHGKYLLLMVVILNVIDCLLVLGELMLDIKYVTDLLTKEYQRSDEFVASMKGLYPDRLGYLGAEDIETLEYEILAAHLTWDEHVATTVHSLQQDVSGADTETSGSSPSSSEPENDHVRKRRASTQHKPSRENSTGSGNYTVHVHQSHSIEEEVAHGLHKASITILGILVLETFFKIFCLGKGMLEHKLECFDGFIVVASFIVDLVFIKGLQQFTVQEFVLILAFMVPWRVIRVVNSLVVAIMDHEHFRLVLLYKQKKKITQELKESKDEVKGLEACIDVLKKLCKDAGMPDSLVDAKLNMYRKVKAKANVMGALSSFAVGGDAMRKPFTNIPNGHTTTPSIVFTVDETNDKETVINNSEVESRNQPEPDRLALPRAYVNKAFEGERRRSYSEPRESEKGELLRKLAESSASFIATINKDDVDLRMCLCRHYLVSCRRFREKVATMTMPDEVYKLEIGQEQVEDTETSDSSTIDSYESKNKNDTDAIVMDNKNNNDDNANDENNTDGNANDEDNPDDDAYDSGDGDNKTQATQL